MAGAQTGRREPEFQGMQLISIKTPLLGVIRDKLDQEERQRELNTEMGDNLSR